MGDPAVYTLGYEGLSIDEFFGILIKNGILHLIDIRRDPVSRRYGFHKKTLANLCDGHGIEYTHLPELGIESRYRKEVKTEDDRNALFSYYETEILKREAEAVALVSRLMSGRPCVLVCFESKPNRLPQIDLGRGGGEGKRATCKASQVREDRYESTSDVLSREIKFEYQKCRPTRKSNRNLKAGTRRPGAPRSAPGVRTATRRKWPFA